jgi:hypothetical protein
MNLFHRTPASWLASAGLAILCTGAAAAETGGTFDPVFAPGLAILKKITGIIESQPDRLQTDWRPNLQLLIGVKAVEASKQTVRFLELTALRPPPTNAAGQPWRPALETNSYSWTQTNVTPPVTRAATYVSTLYPVRVRVFDDAGRKLKEGQTTLPWGLLTNGLADLCRLSMEFSLPRKKAAATGPADRESYQVKVAEDPASPEEIEKWGRSFGCGFIWLTTMLGQIRTVPAVSDLWKQAHCAFRLPAMKTMAVVALTRSFDLSVRPRLEEVSLAEPWPAEKAVVQQYWLPVDLLSGNRNLTRAELVVSPASGAELLLGGI